MTEPSSCTGVWLGLALTAVTLLLSTCLNVFLCFLRRKNSTHKVTNERLRVEAHQRQSTIMAEDEEPSDHFHDHDNHHVEQENPIYGNINTTVGDFDDVCYERMTKRQNDIKKPLQPVEPDVNYASINLNVAQKRRKHKHRSQPGQTRHSQDNQLQARLSQPLLHTTTTPAIATFLEVETEEGASLPARNSSPVASSSSIYLNSQQLALEAEERDRERGMMMGPRAWDGVGEWNAVGGREWGGGGLLEDEGAMGCSIGSDMEAETQIVEVEMIHDDSDHFISSSFDHGNSLQDCRM